VAGKKNMIIAILQARLSSTRLPGKVLKPIMNKPMLAYQIERIKKSRLIDKVILATSTSAEDMALVELAQDLGIEAYRGNLENVLDRFYQAGKQYQPDHIVRLTGDCPLLDPGLVDDLIQFHLDGHYDYSSNCQQPTFPDGLDAEIMRWQVLEEAFQEAKLPSEKEHVTPFIHRRPERYQLGHFKNAEDHSGLRWTVDEAKDFELIENIYQYLYPQNPHFCWRDVLGYVQAHPELKNYNTGYERNEGMKKSLLQDKTLG
jgi:spore coat polysaccharide biosynthesis protein SpsF